MHQHNTKVDNRNMELELVRIRDKANTLAPDAMAMRRDSAWVYT